MAYFGINPERYGGWSPVTKVEALENAELPLGRGLREEGNDDD